MAVLTPPELPKLIVNGTKQNKYVCTYKSAWKKEFKQARRDKAKVVGKFIPLKEDGSYGEIKFNDEFIAEYPDLDHFRVFRYKGGKLEFKPVDEEMMTVEQRSVTRKLHGGATWALNKIVADSPIGRALSKTFTKYALDRKILSLAYYLVLERNNALYLYEEFAECTWLPYHRPLTGGAVSRILKGITADDQERFLKHLAGEFSKSCKDGLDGRTFLALDSTSISSYAQSLGQVEYGHNKDLQPLPQVNVLLIVDQVTGMPMYYRTFDGNVPDSKTVRNTIADCSRLYGDMDGKLKVVLVADKGYMSDENVADCLRNGCDFVFNTKVHANGAARQFAIENYTKLLDWNRLDPFLGQTVYSQQMTWAYDPFPVSGKRKERTEKGKVWFHMYYSSQIHDDHLKVLKTNLARIMQKQNSTPDLITPYEKRFVDEYMDEHDGRVSINMMKVENATKLKGVRVLLSSCIADPFECAMAYEDRIAVEEAFNNLKSRLKCNRLRVHEEAELRGKMFVQIIATAIAGMVHRRIKTYNDTAAKTKADKNSYQVFHDSDVKLLAKLNNAMVTCFRDGWYFDEIAGKRKELFKILDVPVPTAEQCISGAVENAEEEPDTAENTSDRELETMEGEPL